MALNNFSALMTSLANWLNRQDLNATLPDFIAMAEARFNRELRTNDMVKRKYLVTSDAYFDHPDDWLQTRAIRITSPNEFDALEYVAPEEYYDLYNDLQSAGTPRYWSIINNKIALLPVPDGPITIEQEYYAKIPALSLGNPTNWLLTRSPDLYLYGSLLGAEAFLMNDERVPLWATAAANIIQLMNLEAEKAIRPSGQLRAKKRTFG